MKKVNLMDYFDEVIVFLLEYEELVWMIELWIMVLKNVDESELLYIDCVKFYCWFLLNVYMESYVFFEGNVVSFD